MTPLLLILLAIADVRPGDLYHMPSQEDTKLFRKSLLGAQTECRRRWLFEDMVRLQRCTRVWWNLEWAWTNHNGYRPYFEVWYNLFSIRLYIGHQAYLAGAMPIPEMPRGLMDR